MQQIIVSVNKSRKNLERKSSKDYLFLIKQREAFPQNLDFNLLENIWPLDYKDWKGAT